MVPDKRENYLSLTDVIDKKCAVPATLRGGTFPGKPCPGK